MGNDFVNKRYLLLIKGLIIDEGRECRHSAVMIELSDFPDKQPERSIAVFTFIIIGAAEFLSKHTLQFIVIRFCKRQIVIELVYSRLVLVLFNIPVDLLAIVFKVVCSAESFSLAL